MASYFTGKICILLFFFYLSIFIVSVSCSSTPLTEDPQVSADSKTQTDNDASNLLYCHQQAQIDKLEQLVKNLTELVAKLGSIQYETPGIRNVKKTLDFDGDEIKAEGSSTREKRLDRREVETTEGRLKIKSSVTKYSGYWSEQFRFVSAVNLDSIAMSLTVLPFLDQEGHSKYVAIGDDQGRVYVFLKNGEVLVEFYTLSDSPVTAMASYMSVYKNESIVVTGHSNGAILVQRIWETSSGEDWSTLQMENVVSLDSVGVGESVSSISLLEVHYVGRSRYVISCDMSGRIKVFKEDGELHGVVVPSSRPLAFLKQRLLFLTESGAGSLDLRSMKIKEVECEGLNRSIVKHYAFDPTERLKAYGVTSSGDMIHALLMGDVTNFKCRVRSWKNTGLDDPLAFQVIKGYLLIADHDKLHVYNISSQHYARTGAPRLVFSTAIDSGGARNFYKPARKASCGWFRSYAQGARAPLGIPLAPPLPIDDISSSFNKGRSKDLQQKETKRVPVIASDRERLVVVGFGSGCVGVYRSNLPVMKGESSSMLWTSPVLFFVLFLFGLWHFFAKKKESLTIWGPDDPLSSTSVTNQAPSGGSGSGSGDRSFSDGSDLRSNGYNGGSRRFGSPTRYAVGGGNTFRPSSVETSSRAKVDPNFRGAPEMKYRGSNMESGGFQKRRENMYGNSQGLDESS